jgi:SET domain-containing protein
MKRPGTSTTKAMHKPPAYLVKQSKVHGTGVFARRAIAAGDCIIEYVGERIEWPEALKRSAQADGPLNLTYFFSLNDGRVIDGGSNGNEARFINHSCEPNCEALEHDDGRVYIYSLQEIARGEELSYSYPLIYEGRHTPAVKRAFECRCGAESCSGTMLMPKRSTRYRVQQKGFD